MRKHFFQEQEDAILEDDTEAEAVGSVRQALEAKLGARRLEAEIQACCFSKVYSMVLLQNVASRSIM